ncbi:hypothetical protein ECHLIB_0438 [Ehrlichia chaffeensis str. Liberty]|uniref:DUF3023 domain-containing protein n=1 Tax=Ehrlichia chaffeensis TaxID=945 RepID=UPI000444AF4D|nr:DUF3023 domain-containing protein [Ehrlichia chaffeensis]AHX06499.1 hypothetical protein ECHLIB_0438 [Ehrlichia chaffeensis str. Liberty]AHX07683.1 hypothetical protein ECHOSC_0625 [Ehrlichia chaffeensis str. Osceola]AHX08954.1 hypothetical protein ECHSTV_0430 [Ehrlichia chaffeensis str. Saint Vincent]AHX09201.1 hypothetical protein ECHWAK_0437 [Ehrlichia chaffeensis str. Wakulla]
MLNRQYIRGRTTYNLSLCNKLSICAVNLKSCYVIGNTGPRGKTLVRVTQTHKDEKLPIPNTGDTIFLLKGNIPAYILRDDPELRRLTGKRNLGPFTRSAHFHIYLVVSESKIDEFRQDVSSNVDRDGKVFTCGNLGYYGDLVLGRIPGGPYDCAFNECRDLEYFSGLDLDFVVSKQKPDDSSCCQSCIPRSTKQDNTQNDSSCCQSCIPRSTKQDDTRRQRPEMRQVLAWDYDLQSAVNSQGFVEEEHARAQEREEREQRYRVRAEVMTELMDISVAGIESDLNIIQSHMNK